VKKMILLYLWSGPPAINPGIYLLSIPQMADDLDIPEKTGARHFRDLANGGWFVYDLQSRLVFFPKWCDYDVPRNVNTIKSFVHHCKELPPSSLILRFVETLRPYANQHGIDVDAELAEQIENCSGTESELLGNKTVVIPATVSSEQLAVNSEQREKVGSGTNGGSNTTRQPNEERASLSPSPSEFSSLKDEELDTKKPKHFAEILKRTLARYNKRIQDIKPPGRPILQLSTNAIETFMACLRQGEFAVPDLFKAIDGCLSSKWHRERGSRMTFGVIFKDADAVNGLILSADKPEIDDLGEPIRKTVDQGIYGTENARQRE